MTTYAAKLPEEALDQGARNDLHGARRGVAEDEAAVRQRGDAQGDGAVLRTPRAPPAAGGAGNVLRGARGGGAEDDAAARQRGDAQGYGAVLRTPRARRPAGAWR